MISEIDNMVIKTTTNYPVSGEINYEFTNVPIKEIEFAIRIPEFSEENYSVDILVNEKEDSSYVTRVENGFYFIKGVFKEGMKLRVELDVTPKKVYANTAVRYDAGCVAITRGPMVYCFEGKDNEGLLQSLRVKKNGNIVEESFDELSLNGIIKLNVEGYKMIGSDRLYSYERPKANDCNITAIPYYIWGNRGLNQMRVWMNEE